MTMQEEEEHWILHSAIADKQYHVTHFDKTGWYPQSYRINLVMIDDNSYILLQLLDRQGNKIDNQTLSPSHFSKAARKSTLKHQSIISPIDYVSIYQFGKNKYSYGVLYEFNPQLSQLRFDACKISSTGVVDVCVPKNKKLFIQSLAKFMLRNKSFFARQMFWERHILYKEQYELFIYGGLENINQLISNIDQHNQLTKNTGTINDNTYIILSDPLVLQGEKVDYKYQLIYNFCAVITCLKYERSPLNGINSLGGKLLAVIDKNFWQDNVLGNMPDTYGQELAKILSLGLEYQPKHRTEIDIICQMLIEA